MSNTNSKNKEIQRGTGNGRAWHSRGRGRAGGPSNTRQTAAGHAQQPEATITTSPLYAQTTRQRMNLMASVSRSSGLQRDGDDLKNYQTQVEYRNFIQEKLDNVLTRYQHPSWRTSESEKEKRQRIDSQENVLILFRKLREGIASSGRNDLFALEVYELSLYLAVIFQSPKQAATIIPNLFTRPDTTDSTTILVRSPSIHSVLISLLHYLVTFYPSQSSYDQHRSQIPLRKQSKASSWLASLTKSLRMRNYAKFGSLSDKKSVLEVIGESTTTLDENWIHANSDLGTRALLFVVDSLRRKAGDSAWDTIRSAYRELSCDPSSLGTKTWLRKSLCLDSVILGDSSSSDSELESWLEQKIPLGHVRHKEGVEGRWIICKVR